MTVACSMRGSPNTSRRISQLWMPAGRTSIIMKLVQSTPAHPSLAQFGAGATAARGTGESICSQSLVLEGKRSAGETIPQLLRRERLGASKA